MTIDDSKYQDAIYFYAKDKAYGELSNFFRCDFFLDDHKWMTVEHFYQASKFLGNPCYMEKVRLANTPKIARQLGQSREAEIVKEWDDIKEKVMRKALRAKFLKTGKFKDLLLETGEKCIIEASPYDYYWGCGSDGSGKNRLGELLMELREELKNE